MTDARWEDVEANIADAVKHFSMAVRLRETGTFDGTEEQAYVHQMALMHAMQSGHTSAESALLRILSILDEEAPTGADWHKALIDRLSRPVRGDHARPALLTGSVKADLDETRSFRHRVTHDYGSFDVRRSAPSLEAAARLTRSLPAAIAAFKRTVDPGGET